jgi:amino acid adenylation domain-containing protein
LNIEQLLSELRARGFRLWTENGRLLFEGPQGQMTPALREQIAEHKSELIDLLSAAAAAPETARRVIDERQIDGDMRLSFAQQRLWFLDQLEPGTGRYNIPMTFRISGGLQIAALETAINKLVDRHAVLRTTFSAHDGHPVHHVRPELLIPVAVEDMTERRESEREAAAQRRIQEAAKHAFNLESGPLIRVLVLRLDIDQHILLVNIHHIVCDGWSRAVFNRELSRGYAAAVRGLDIDLPPLSLQYADYSQWQNETLKGAELRRQLDYWTLRLADLPRLNLATDKPRPAYLGRDGQDVPVTLPRDLSDALVAIARQNNVTPFMLLLTSFAVLLHRYSSQNDIAIGTPIAGRTQTRFEDLIGLFVNTLVIRADLSDDPSFIDMLSRIRDVALGAYEHQDLPFEKLVEELAPARDTSRNPLFQVMFSFQNTPEHELELADLEVSPFRFDRENSKFDLSLTLRASPEGFTGTFNYNTDLFEAESIARFASHYRQLLESIAADPAQPISTFELMTETERRQILEEWNGQDAGFPQTRCVHELFEARVEQTPDAVAISFEKTQLSYDDLNCRSNQLAHYLINLGVKSGDSVGLCLERSSELIIAILGILKAGAAYLPVDPTTPSARTNFILSDARARILLTQQSLIEIAPDFSGRVVSIDGVSSDIAHAATSNPVNTVRPDDLAYVIYTSGSTGKPKGVGVTHANVTRLFAATDGAFQFSADDVWTLFHSYAFDFSVWEIWGALLYGGRLVIVPHWISRTPDDFYALLLAEHVTVLNQTPSAFQQLVRAESVSTANDELRLRYVIFGGEALDIGALRPWFDRHGDEHPRLINMYGITETTVHTTYRPLTIADMAGGSVIGRPIADMQVYLLDAGQKLVPIGVPGEIYVGGPGVSRGYLNLAELTAERFIPNPFTMNSSDRLYRSGDLARYRQDGDIEYLGRIDRQIQLRGFRIELGEIEAVLAHHVDVQELCVVAAKDKFKETRLTAYFTTSPGGSGSDAPSTTTGECSVAAELRRYARTRLPEYMVPSAFVLLDAFPLNASGKIDRDALPAAEAFRPESAGILEAVRDAIEKTLVEIWKDILAQETVAPYDNFFDLGGHSLLAVRAINRINVAYGIALQLRVLFEAPTLRGLANEIEILINAQPADAGSHAADQRIPAIPRVPRKNPKSR